MLVLCCERNGLNSKGKFENQLFFRFFVHLVILMNYLATSSVPQYGSFFGFSNHFRMATKVALFLKLSENLPSPVKILRRPFFYIFCMFKICLSQTVYRISKGNFLKSILETGHHGPNHKWWFVVLLLGSESQITHKRLTSKSGQKIDERAAFGRALSEAHSNRFQHSSSLITNY